MSNTPTTPAPNATAALIIEFAQIGLGVLAEFATGGLAGDVAIAAKVTALIAGALPLISSPSLTGITGLLGQGAALLESVTTGAAQADAKLAAAILQMVQAAASAVQAQAGQAINPALVPQEAPLVSSTAPAGTTPAN